MIVAIVLFCFLMYKGIAGIRMKDDKEETMLETVRLKFLRVQDGTIYYKDNMDSSFHVGDMMSMDTSGKVEPFQTFFSQKVVVVGRYAEYKY